MLIECHWRDCHKRANAKVLVTDLESPGEMWLGFSICRDHYEEIFANLDMGFVNETTDK